MNASVLLAVLLVVRPVESDPRALVRLLGSPSHRARQSAQERLAALCRRDRASLAPVAVGLFDRDAEVRLRCHGIARRIDPCVPCAASGWAYLSTGGYIQDEYEPCHACRGFGSAWIAQQEAPTGARRGGKGWACD